MKTITMFALPQEAYKSHCLTPPKMEETKHCSEHTRNVTKYNAGQVFQWKHQGANINTSQ